MTILDKLVDKVKHNHDGSSSSAHDSEEITPAQAIARDYETTGDITPMNNQSTFMGGQEAIPLPNQPRAQRAPSVTSTVSTSASINTQATETRRLHKWQSHFHDEMDADEQLVADYSCALNDVVLIQGYLYVSQKHIAFGSNILGLKRRICFPIKDITAVRKRMTAKIIPNGMTIEAAGETYQFATLNTRDATFDLITDMWRVANPEAFAAAATQERDVLNTTEAGDDANEDDVKADMSRGDVKTHAATQAGTKPFKEVVLDIRLPTSPAKAFDLVFKNQEFYKKFASEQMKLRDIEMEDWSGEPPKRKFHYTKPLNGSVGPKETKCYISEEELHNDPEGYLEMLTTTKNPDVPSGDAFECKTKTSCSWAGGQKGGCKLLVTTQVDWSGRSMLKGVITKSSIEGQREYHKALATELRAYIKEHADEFKSGETVDAEADDELDGDAENEKDSPAEEEAEPFVSQAISGLMDIPNQPALIIMTALALLLLITNIITLSRSSSASTKAVAVVDTLPASAMLRLERLELFVEQFKKLAAAPATDSVTA